MKKEKADRKISVRLNDEANKKVIDAVNKGISKSEFINNASICDVSNMIGFNVCHLVVITIFLSDSFRDFLRSEP